MRRLLFSFLSILGIALAHSEEASPTKTETVYIGEFLTEKIPADKYPPQEGVCRIFILRHGETDWNVQGLSQGWNDIPLNETAEDLAKDLGCRFLLVNAHSFSMKTIDRFVNFYKTMPPNTHYHFNCANGRALTTAFLVVQDMLLNATQVKADVILARHDLSGELSLPMVDMLLEFHKRCLAPLGS